MLHVRIYFQVSDASIYGSQLFALPEIQAVIKCLPGP